MLLRCMNFLHFVLRRIFNVAALSAVYAYSVLGRGIVQKFRKIVNMVLLRHVYGILFVV